jgi:hypothetical protein
MSIPARAVNQASGRAQAAARHKLALFLGMTPEVVLASGLARSAGIEPATHCLEGSCSIQLSYERNLCPGVIMRGSALLASSPGALAVY